LAENGIFNATTIYLPLTAPQPPVSIRDVQTQILFFNGFPIDKSSELNIQLLIQFLTIKRFNGHLIFSNLLNVKNCSKTTLVENIKQFENLFFYLSNAFGKVHILPGVNDISNLTLPILPWNKNIFPRLINNENVVLHSNPTFINIEGVVFYIMSDTCITDLKQNYDIDLCSVGIMERLLEFRQVLPSASSTIPSRPIVSSKSPFILSQIPHYFFSLSSTDEFATEKVKTDSFCCQNVVVPNFFSSSKALLFSGGNVDPLIFC
jgi:hypothetical protein